MHYPILLTGQQTTSFVEASTKSKAWEKMGSLQIYSSFVVLGLIYASAEPEKRLGKERVVFQTEFGDIEMAFYPEVQSLWKTVPEHPLPDKECVGPSHFILSRIDQAVAVVLCEILASPNEYQYDLLASVSVNTIT